ncbi:unnamed protein product [Ophioblennius macclurei]
MQKNVDLGEKSKSPPRVTPARRIQRARQEPSEKPLDPQQLVGGSPQLAERIRSAADELKIRQADRSWAADLVNDFRESLLKFLRSGADQPFFQSAEFLNTGSYFEKVKIYRADEFDMMLKIPVTTRFSLTPLDDGLFYRIELIRPTRTPVQAFLVEDELTLSSSRVLGEVYRLVRKFLKTYKVPDAAGYRWEVKKKNPYSPAVTLSLCKLEDGAGDELISVDVVPALEVQSWPNAVRGGPKVEKWLGKKARQEIRSLPCYFVPKRRKGRNLSEEDKSSAKESWRISFSHIEKRFMTSHGNTRTCCESKATRCCRKQCLMLLKALIERLKQSFPEKLGALCSYHGKTAFFHALSSRHADSQWAKQDLAVCFVHLLDVLQGHAQEGVLPHFFVPECNLFSPDAFPRRELMFLVDALNQQKQEGLPLLKLPAPAPPLPLPPLQPETVSADEFFSPSRFHPVDSAFITKILPVLLVVFLAALCHMVLR